MYELCTCIIIAHLFYIFKWVNDDNNYCKGGRKKDQQTELCRIKQYKKKDPQTPCHQTISPKRLMTDANDAMFFIVSPTKRKPPCKPYSKALDLTKLSYQRPARKAIRTFLMSQCWQTLLNRRGRASTGLERRKIVD